jgi:hypothetical protein
MVPDQRRFSSRQTQQQPDWNKKEIRLHFTFESGSMLHFKRELHCLRKKYYIYNC